FRLLPTGPRVLANMGLSAPTSTAIRGSTSSGGSGLWVLPSGATSTSLSRSSASPMYDAAPRLPMEPLTAASTTYCENSALISARMSSGIPPCWASDTSQKAGGIHHTRSSVLVEPLVTWISESRSLTCICSGGRACGRGWAGGAPAPTRSEEHTSELQSRENLVCRLLL